ncbi:MAG TPA: hypothetical protein VKP14_03305 [Gaiellaceae bacterium]|nr:hypothetical protein [Gaiellaceae bacterium]
MAEGINLDGEGVPPLQLADSFDVLSRLPEADKNKLFSTLLTSLRSDAEARHTFAAVILIRERSLWTESQIATMTTIAAETISRNAGKRLASLLASIGNRPEHFSEAFRSSVAGALRLQAGVEGPGSGEVSRALNAFADESEALTAT